MLTALSIRDVVLIERLDLCVRPWPDCADRRDRRRQVDPAGQPRPRTGRAGRCGPGARGRRAGQRHRLLRAARGTSADARCSPSRDWRPRTRSCFAACWRRDGRSRAFINDQPVGVALLRRAAALLVEVQGQHEQIGLADPAEPRRAARRVRRAAAAARCRPRRHGATWRDAIAALDGGARGDRRGANVTRSGCATRWMNWPAWRRSRTRRSGSRRNASDCSRASGAPRRSPRRSAELAPRDRRSPAPGRGACARPAARCSAWSRRRSRMRPIRPGRRSPRWNAPRRRWPRRRRFLTRLAHEAEADPRLLEQAEERLFALRAVARKHARRGGGAAGAARYAVHAAGRAGYRRRRR